MTKTDEELEAILAGTEGVTPGPWAGNGFNVSAPAERRYRITVAHTGIVGNPPAYAPTDELNAKHIRRLDPETVASIIRELLAYRRSPAPLQAQTSVPAETLPDAFITCTSDRPNYYVTVKTKELRGAQQWHDAILELARAVSPAPASAQVTEEPTAPVCGYCKGTGTEVEYFGPEMKPYETTCAHCNGSGVDPDVAALHPGREERE